MGIRDVITSARRRGVADASSAVPDGAPWGSRLDVEARRVASSALFDAGWYAGLVGCDPHPLDAARHYLSRGASQGADPHPLFCSQWLVPRLSAALDGASPLVAYLDQQAFSVPTHPLFDMESYLRACPSAATHPDGPVGHYIRVGAALELAPNDWYRIRDEEPRGLVDWVLQRRSAWRQRRVAGTAPEPTEIPGPETLDADALAAATVSVVVQATGCSEHLVTTVRSLCAQDLQPVELVVVTSDEPREVLALLRELAPALASRVVECRSQGAVPALNDALAGASGVFCAWVLAGETWGPDRLRGLLSTCVAAGRLAAYDNLLLRRADRPHLLSATSVTSGAPLTTEPVALSRLLVAKEVLLRLGSFDETLEGGWEADLTFRLLAEVEAAHHVRTGVDRPAGVSGLDPALGEARTGTDMPTASAYNEAAFNNVAVDWEGLASSTQSDRTVTVIISTRNSWRLVAGSVARVHRAGAPAGWSLQCVVVDDGSDELAATVLSSLEQRFPGTHVVHLPTTFGSSLSVNLALPHVAGEVVVLLERDVHPTDGWLDPLVARLANEQVLGVQPLVLDSDGLVESAGYVFPQTRDVPYSLLEGMPREDADNLVHVPLAALGRAAVAIRRDDLVQARGLDPQFRGGLEDVDLCLRIAAARPGRFEVVPASQVRRRRPRRDGPREILPQKRQLWLDRWSARQPRDDRRVSAEAGFTVVGYHESSITPIGRHHLVPRPVLSRTRVEVDEQSPRLRWAIKVASPVGDYGERWGDTHFARSLAAALRGIGQQVVVDHRENHARPSGRHDDVVLVLRGLEAYKPLPGQVNLAWVISHPELFTAAEAATYDRVLAASTAWAARTSRTWGVRIDPLLQATDPVRFHPGRATPDVGEEIVFVGGSRKQYRVIVRHSVESGLPIAVYGTDWERYIPPRLIKALSVPNDEVGALYASAGVVLNDHWDDMRREGFLSNRLFDAAASGARVITDDVQGLGALFGRSVQVATDARRLADLAAPGSRERVFGTYEERCEVARRVHREHSFEMRAARLVEVALELRHAPGPLRRPTVDVVERLRSRTVVRAP